MDTLSFLKHVLPSEGVYVKAVLGDRMKQTFHTSVEKLYASITASHMSGENIYYAVASFNDNSARKQENVKAIKSFFMDVDCGPSKPYATWKEGLVALGKFVQEMGLPKPLIVASGNGLHVYWVLDQEITVARWQPIADAMKRAAKAKDFQIDMVVVSDSARILRPVGTVNPKGNSQVRVLINAEPVSLEDIEVPLGPYAERVISNVHNTAETKVHKKRSLLDDLAVRSEFAPAIPHVLTSKCQQLDWAVTNQGDVAEPMWYLVMGVAAACENPEQTAIEWSKNHPAYDEAKTLQKMRHWKNATTGPATCERFESERPKGCKGCKFKGKISTPARLGIQHKEVEAAPDVPDATASEVPVPWPFKRASSGMKITIDETDLDVCSFEIYPVSYGYDEVLGYEVVRFKWKRPHVGWTELVLRQAYLVAGAAREFGSTIADQGIVLSSSKQTEHFQQMLRSYMEELRKIRSMTNLYATMGWKENYTQFLLGDMLIKKEADGSIVREKVSLSGRGSGEELYGSAGTLEAAVQFTSLLEKRKLYVHQFALGVGLSTVLYDFTGIAGIVINLYGQTGAGKTLAQLWQQSLWGPPKKLHFGARFTYNSFFSRLALHNHLPVTVDETTMIPTKDIGDFIYGVSQGVDKARLTRTAEVRDAKTWATAVTTSSNKPFDSALVASNMESGAQQARLMDISVPLDPLFAKDSTAGERIYHFLMNNYGHIGPALVEHFMRIGPSDLIAMIEDHKVTFVRKYDAEFSGEERYWRNAIVLADFALKEAQSLGLIQFNYEESTRYILTQLGALRQNMKNNTMDAFDIIGEYLNEHASTTVTVMHTGVERPIADHSRMPRDGIHIRFDVYRKNNVAPFNAGVMLFDRKHFRTWTATHGFDYKAILREIEHDGANATPASQKAYLGRDTPIKLPQTYVVGINLSHSRLAGILNEAEEAMENLTLGSLSVISGGKDT